MTLVGNDENASPLEINICQGGLELKEASVGKLRSSGTDRKRPASANLAPATSEGETQRRKFGATAEVTLGLGSQMQETAAHLQPQLGKVVVVSGGSRLASVGKRVLSALASPATKAFNRVCAASRYHFSKVRVRAPPKLQAALTETHSATSAAPNFTGADASLEEASVEDNKADRNIANETNTAPANVVEENVGVEADQEQAPLERSMDVAPLEEEAGEETIFSENQANAVLGVVEDSTPQDEAEDAHLDDQPTEEAPITHEEMGMTMPSPVQEGWQADEELCAATLEVEVIASPEEVEEQEVELDAVRQLEAGDSNGQEESAEREQECKTVQDGSEEEEIPHVEACDVQLHVEANDVGLEVEEEEKEPSEADTDAQLQQYEEQEVVCYPGQLGGAE